MLDQVFLDRRGFDAIVYYEDLITDPQGTLAGMTELGWSCAPQYLRLERKPAAIKQYNESCHPQIIDRLEYDVGNHRGGHLTRDFAQMGELPEPEQEVCRWCPAVSEHYRLLMQQPGRQWVGLG